VFQRVTCPNEFVQAGSPVCAGVVPGSEVSGKVVWSDPCTEVSQTTVSVLTPYQVRGRLKQKLHTEAIRSDEVPHAAEVQSSRLSESVPN